MARPSVTATLVAMARGVTGVDPLASRLLPALPAALVSVGRKFEPLVRGLTLGFVEHVRARTELIDDALAKAVDSRLRQVVILGAGMDSRAFRLPCLKGTRVFELDQPATQALKRARAQGLAPIDLDHRLIPIDLARDDLDAALANAGHLEAEPTFWVWEGVTMYLPRPALEQTLEAVQRRSPPRSWLAVSYVAERLFSASLPSWVAGRLLDAFGEPLEGVIATASLHALLDQFGFSVRQDDACAEGPLAPLERVVLAERT